LELPPIILVPETPAEAGLVESPGAPVEERTLPGDSLAARLDVQRVEPDSAETTPVQPEDTAADVQPSIGQPEEQPPGPGAETEAETGATLVQYDAGAAAIKSLLIPGLGQMTTDKPVRGVAFLGGAATAVTIGFLSTTKEVACAGGYTDECPPDLIRGETTTRPHMTTSLIVAGAFAVASAIDAFLGAKRAVPPPRTVDGPEETGPKVSIDRPRLGYSQKRLEVEFVRFRFR
jgi:hypothetical protein